MYRSVTHATRNENGFEEISIERDAGLIEWSRMMLSAGTTNVDRAIIECYEMRGFSWRNKATGEVPDVDKQTELFELKRAMEANSAAMNRVK